MRTGKLTLRNILERIPLFVSILLIFTLIADFGFKQNIRSEILLDWIDVAGIALYLIAIVYRYTVIRPFHQRLRLTIIDIGISAILLLSILEIEILGHLEHPAIFYMLFFIVFFRELSTTDLSIANRSINPALLFVSSFLFLIILGTLLLLLPNATYDGISFTDALFTSTSAVCVTGLIVVDTGTYFTLFGQIILLTLIQLGGLGIMTFTSFFSLFFTGSSTFQDHMMLQDITKSEKIGEVVSTLKRIVITTFTVEAAAMVLIFVSLGSEFFNGSFADKLYFSVFHAISAFCNAGFSTLSDSLYETPFRFAYGFQLIVTFTFVIGGLGFPIVHNLLQLIKYRSARLLGWHKGPYRPWILHINARIILLSTAILLAVGGVMVFIFEYDHALSEHSLGGKIVTAFFAGATPRTAGFNNIDMTGLQLGTVLITIFLMWIGASPGSTGGGIKTTTFAVATLNFLSLARGKDRIEIFRREVSNVSVQRSFATISLSIIILSAAIFILKISEPGLTLTEAIFECFSAFSTVGLSLGITGVLGTSGKILIIIVMFIGRVGALTLLIAFLRSKKNYNYRYPVENILIN